MTPETWAAVGSLCAVAGVGAGLVRHLVKYSYDEGQKDARLAALEKHRDESLDAGKLMAGLEVTVRTLSSTVEKLDHTVNNMLQGKIELPRRRRADADA